MHKQHSLYHQKTFIAKVIQNIYSILYDSLYTNHNDLSENPFLTLDENYDVVEDLSIHSAKECISKIVDYESLVKMFILQEIVQDYDVGWSSFYLSIDCSEKGSKKLVFEAPWDFDLAFGWSNRAYTDSLYLFSNNNTSHQYHNPWFMLFSRCDWFFEDICSEWNNFKENNDLEYIIKSLYAELLENLDVLHKEFVTWPRDIPETDIEDFDDFKAFYLKKCDNTFNYLRIKFDALDEMLSIKLENNDFYSIGFAHDEKVIIKFYSSKECTDEGEITDLIHLTDMSGDGQINFKIILEEGFGIDSISINGQYKNLKDPLSTGIESVYRITKISSDLEVTITIKPIENI